MQAELLASDTGGALWLTHNRDIVAHLFFVAAEIGRVELDVGPLTVAGTMSFADTRRRRFRVGFADVPAVRPDHHDVVRVRYARGNAEYSFLTAVCDAPDARSWSLDYPRTIERNERRIVARRRVFSAGGFRVRVHGADGVTMLLPLYDLSMAGLGFIYLPATLAVHIGSSLAATLVLSGGATLPVLLEVANQRDLPGGHGERVAGCVFVGISSHDMGTLARSLVELSHRRR